MEYWYIFPISVCIAIVANASGFSGSVLFQPIFNFFLQIPIESSIATGIATETIGMSSGAYRYYRMGKVNMKLVIKVLPFVIIGIIWGVFVFITLPKLILRLVVGAVIFSIASKQLFIALKGNYLIKEKKDISCTIPEQVFAGVASASTGTGMAEIHQPIFEHEIGLETKKANASAIMVEALGNWLISFFNLSVGNIRFDILIFSSVGVLIGSQIGAIISPYLPDRILKIVFGVSVSIIGLIYIITSAHVLY
jgi:uncharacterized membrane protein YfcA|tara:strand:+ start:9636 stop:10391 length:756 start_codon:yes stop_codon:yes gene_type:complete